MGRVGVMLNYRIKNHDDVGVRFRVAPVLLVRF
jgi:hypothetical protein